MDYVSIRNLPNYLTILRILLVPAFYTMLVYYRPENDQYRWYALSLFIFASLTDAADGFIARRWKCKTEFGTFLDPLADKLLLVSAFIGISVSALPVKPPLWVLSIVIFREIIILIGLAAIFAATQSLKIQPNMLGKATTFFQMLAIIVLLAQYKIALFFWFLTASLTVASGIVYIVREMRRLNGISISK